MSIKPHISLENLPTTDTQINKSLGSLSWVKPDEVGDVPVGEAFPEVSTSPQTYKTRFCVYLKVLIQPQSLVFLPKFNH